MSFSNQWTAKAGADGRRDGTKDCAHHSSENERTTRRLKSLDCNNSNHYDAVGVGTIVLG
jgi:hypothetical protein